MSKLDKKAEAIGNALSIMGYSKDAYGHYVKETQAYRLRVKMQATSVRLEIKEAKPNAEWSKVDGAYMKDVVILTNADALPDGVKIGRKIVKGKA